MNSNLLVSLILCTCNRVGSLRQTLTALGTIRIPIDWRAELIVVDNGSTDDTAALLKQIRLPNMTLKTVLEPRTGKSHALNTGMALAEGEIMLFMDDDVIPMNDWMVKMVAAFSKTKCDAVVGKIELAHHLHRPWLRTRYQALLGVLDFSSGPVELVGASAGVRRSVLEKIPGYDPELGPGALGLGEDTLFGQQMERAGFKLTFVADARVYHHPEVSRLTRRAWLGAARNLGRTNAYLRYHWEHDDIKHPFARFHLLRLKLWLRRILQVPDALDGEGCPEWELSYVWQLEMYRQFCVERRRPRNYAKHGLTKVARETTRPAQFNQHKATSHPISTIGQP